MAATQLRIHFSSTHYPHYYKRLIRLKLNPNYEPELESFGIDPERITEPAYTQLVNETIRDLVAKWNWQKHFDSREAFETVRRYEMEDDLRIEMIFDEVPACVEQELKADPSAVKHLEHYFYLPITGDYVAMRANFAEGHSDILKSCLDIEFLDDRVVDLLLNTPHLSCEYRAVDLAVSQGSIRLLERIRAKYPEQVSIDQLMGAAENGHIPMMKYLVETVDSGDLSEAIDNAFNSACYDMKVMRYLISIKPDVEVYYETVLGAIEIENLEMLEMLLKTGYHPISNEMIYAVNNKKTASIEMMLKFGADLEEAIAECESEELEAELVKFRVPK